MPTGIMQTVSSYMCNGGIFLCAKHLSGCQTRGGWVIFSCIVGMISAIFLYTLDTTKLRSRLGALYVSYFCLGGYIVALGMNTANTAGRAGKVTTNSMIFIAYCAPFQHHRPAVLQGRSGAAVSFRDGRHSRILRPFYHNN